MNFNHPMAVFTSRLASAIAIAGMLSSCATQIQMTCAVPSRVGLQKSTALEIQAKGSPLSKEIQATLSQELQQGLFYTIAPEAEYQLRISDTKEHTRIKDLFVVKDEWFIDNETELITRISIFSKTNSAYAYSQEYSVTSDGYDGDIEALCHDIASDLQPHRLIYTEKLDAPDDNPAFEKATDYCKDGMWQHAAKAAEQAVQLTPHEPEAHYLQGLIQRQLENYAASDTSFHKAYQLKPDARYAEAVKINKLMQMGARYVRHQMKFTTNDEAVFNKATLPAYHKKKDMPWTQLFIPMNL